MTTSYKFQDGIDNLKVFAATLVHTIASMQAANVQRIAGDDQRRLVSILLNIVDHKELALLVFEMDATFQLRLDLSPFVDVVAEHPAFDVEEYKVLFNRMFEHHAQLVMQALPETLNAYYFGQLDAA